jgi:ankyrin repeat protein
MIALHIASQEDHVVGAAVVLAAGADINTKNKYGCTPLGRASGEGGDAAAVEALLTRGADTHA